MTHLPVTITALTMMLASTAIAVAQDIVEDTDAPQQRTQEPLGWTVPLTPMRDSDIMSELDRLSKSASGVTFGGGLYNSRADNPLIPVSVTLRALDKITATYHDLVIPINDEVRFGALNIVPRTCDKRPPEETPEISAFIEIFTTQSDVQGARTRQAIGEVVAPQARSIRIEGEEAEEPTSKPALFRGWMFASSPSLNALEHPVYDVWVSDCKMVDPEQ